MINFYQLDYPEARELLDYIVEQAGPAPIATCVVDATGKLLAAAAINGAASHYMDFALAKARTALKEGNNTVYYRFTEDVNGNMVPKDGGWSEWELTHAAQLSPGFCGWAGGTLVVNPANGFCAGAIGVSGESELDDHKHSIKRPSGWVA